MAYVCPIKIPNTPCTTRDLYVRLLRVGDPTADEQTFTLVVKIKFMESIFH